MKQSEVDLFRNIFSKTAIVPQHNCVCMLAISIMALLAVEDELSGSDQLSVSASVRASVGVYVGCLSGICQGTSDKSICQGMRFLRTSLGVAVVETIWVSVKTSLGASVGTSVKASVGVSVEPSVGASMNLNCIMYRVIVCSQYLSPLTNHLQ